MSDNYVRQTICRMCEYHCGINVHFENGNFFEIDGNKAHHWNKGRLCAKGRLGIDMVYAPDRLLKPLKKVNNDWQEIELEDALDEIGQKIKKITATHDAKSLGILKGEAVGFAQQEALARRFIHAFGYPR